MIEIFLKPKNFFCNFNDFVWHFIICDKVWWVLKELSNKNVSTQSHQSNSSAQQTVEINIEAITTHNSNSLKCLTHYGPKTA